MRRIVVLWALLLVLPYVALATPVPDTGQTQCYDNTQEITCPNPGEDFYGQDAQYISNPHSYTKLDENGNDLPDEALEWIMIRDNVTGLIWENKTDDGSIHDKDNEYTWQDAEDVFIVTINSHNFGGYNDWRLPTVKELSSILDNSISFPAINTFYFSNTEPTDFWSSTNHAGDPNATAWKVDVGSGAYRGWSKSRTYCVRAVRGGPWASNNFIDNGDGTITDTDTGLMWQKDTAPGTYRWQQALSYCETLNLAGYSDWRLPNRNELQSIANYNYSPPIDPIFSNTVPSLYLTSTTYAQFLEYVWIVFFDDRGATYYAKSIGAYTHVRAVRGYGIDSDHDGIFDDGDISGTLSDNPCTGGQTTNCDDNCPNNPNPTQEDVDSDGVGDACDNCPVIFNPDQDDTDDDSVGDVCDNCPDISNPIQEDTDSDEIGNACDLCPNDYDNDIDEDAVCGDIDNCPDNYNPLQEDTDSSGIGDVCNDLIDADSDEWEDILDNCPHKPNGSALGTCIIGNVGLTCTDNEDCGEIIGFCSRNQEDDYPPNGNGIGDACDCEGNFNCDADVDGTDASTFKADFGRSLIENPCNNESPCNGDFNCDGDCDGTDASRFKQDFGRSTFNNPCPICVSNGPWCNYQ